MPSVLSHSHLCNLWGESLTNPHTGWHSFSTHIEPHFSTHFIKLPVSTELQHNLIHKIVSNSWWTQNWKVHKSKYSKVEAVRKTVPKQVSNFSFNSVLSVGRETSSLTKDHQLQFGYTHLMKPYQDFRGVSQLLSTYHSPSKNKVNISDVFYSPTPNISTNTTTATSAKI